MKVREIAQLMGAALKGSGEGEILWLLTDSRSLSFAAETMFFALPSTGRDSLQFVNELYAAGVRAFVVPRGFESSLNAAECPKAAFLVVDNTLDALQRLAGAYRAQFDLPVVGITGSNGKTVVKEWLYQLLRDDYQIARSPKSYNSQIGVPLSLWGLSENKNLALIEAGISLPGEMLRLERIIRPTIGVFTGLGAAHQENFGNLQEKCADKAKLFSRCDVLVWNSDDETVVKVLSNFAGKSINWSRYDSSAPLYVKSVTRTEATGSLIDCNWMGNLPVLFEIPFVDDASVANACTCAALCLHLGISADTLSSRMRNLVPVAMRLDVREGVKGITLINDSYNSDYTSLDIALDFMNRRKEAEGRSKVLVLGDMQQTGENPETLKEKVLRLIEARGVDRTFFCGEEFARVIGGEDAFSNVDQFLSSNSFAQLQDCVVLLKGSHDSGFDRICDRLEKRVHETILEVDLGAVADNLKYFRSMLNPQTKIVCMVKAAAYGAGAVEVSRTLQNCGVDYLAVAVADEGVELRNAGIRTNIMVMNPELSALDTLFRYNLQPEVYSFRLLEALIAAARAEGITQYPVHIKLDTGMHRLGFDPLCDMEKLVKIFKGQQALAPASVFSHFVGSDDDSFDGFSTRQMELFQKGADALQAACKHHIVRHICNSAGIEHFPQHQMDMVRLGLGLYGISSRDGRILNNVSSLRTTILQIHEVPAGDTVGYSRRGKITRTSRIAALPIGYADGLNRRLGNGNGYCIINGCKAPYVGNICMDVCMVDVTGIPCAEGDKALIFGAPELPVTLLSTAVGTIPYEILTSVSNRVKRVYFRE